MTSTTHEGSAALVEKKIEKHQKHETPPDGISAVAVRDAQDEGKAKSEKIEKLIQEDDKQYDSDVGKLVVTKLLGKNGKDKDGHDVEGSDGRRYPGSIGGTLPELDENGKPTGKMIKLDELSNGDLAKLLEKTIADYDKSGDRDGGKAYKRERDNSELPAEEKSFSDLANEAGRLARVGEPGRLSQDDLNRLLEGRGEYSEADKKLLEGAGGPEAVEAMTKARDAFQKLSQDTRAFNEQMASEGIFYQGKTKLCCCVNARNKAMAMIFRARTGNPPAGAACVKGHLENEL